MEVKIRRPTVKSKLRELIAAPSHQPTEDLCELLTLDIARMSKKKMIITTSSHDRTFIIKEHVFIILKFE